MPDFVWTTGGNVAPSWDASVTKDGSGVVTAKSTLSCIKCIRAGYTWCSNKWSFNSPSTYDPAVEKGSCCFDVDTGGYVYNGGNTATSLNPPIKIANKNNCPAVYTNEGTGVSTTPS